MQTKPTTCALCATDEAKCSLNRHGRQYKLCIDCRDRTLEHEQKFGCKIGEKIRKCRRIPAFPRHLWWPTDHIKPGSSNLKSEGRIKPTPDIEQLDRWNTKLDYSKENYWRQKR